MDPRTAKIGSRRGYELANDARVEKDVAAESTTT
jgi:hypothetical protein